MTISKSIKTIKSKLEMCLHIIYSEHIILEKVCEEVPEFFQSRGKGSEALTSFFSAFLYIRQACRHTLLKTHTYNTSTHTKAFNKQPHPFCAAQVSIRRNIAVKFQNKIHPHVFLNCLNKKSFSLISLV